MIVRTPRGGKTRGEARIIMVNDALLLLTALIWGLAFVAQRQGMRDVGPFTYNAARFALGALCLLPVIVATDRLRARRSAARDATAPITPAPAPAAAGPRINPVAAGLIAGAVLVFGASLQQVGLVTTSAGKAGFITGLYVILVPLSGLFWRQRAGAGAWGGAILSVAGLALLSLGPSLTVERGDLIVLVGAFFWAAHVQVVGLLSPRTDPLRLSAVQFAVCSVVSAVIAFVVEHPSTAGVIAAAVPILYGGAISVGVAYTLQVVAQRHAPPAHAAILLSLESVFAALGGAVILGERLGVRGTVGCAVMFAGMLAAQAPAVFPRLAPRKAGG